MGSYRFCSYCGEAVELTNENEYDNNVYCDSYCENSQFHEETNGFYLDDDEKNY